MSTIKEVYAKLITVISKFRSQIGVHEPDSKYFVNECIHLRKNRVQFDNRILLESLSSTDTVDWLLRYLSTNKENFINLLSPSLL